MTTVDAFVERLFGAVLGAQECQAIYLGDRLGYYRALAAAGALTSVELAKTTNTAERYAREWLEHQAVSGYLEVDDTSAAPEARRYTLPAAHAEVLTDELSLSYVAPLARMVVGLGKQLDSLLEVYRTGGGVPWSAHGADGREGQADANRPLFLGPLAKEYLPQLETVDAALRAGGRVAEVGCGGGWASIGIAAGYPEATVDGFDVDAPSVELATANAAGYGVGDRARFHVVEGSSLASGDRLGAYDLVCAFECIHDMPDPVPVLAAMRQLCAPGGTVLVMDERVAETFTAPGDEVERLMYGYSLMCCLPDGLAHSPSVATGTVMRPSTLEHFAIQAGFEGIEVLPIENDFFRFYRLITADNRS
jgi:2-polyprenyl-3-methyl-5-hydroxy-6-metoxy-1,4-benzoquinol methylase